MPQKSWEQMTIEEKLDRLRSQFHSLADFINNFALPQLEGRLAQLATRITALEAPPTDNGEVEPK
jgi:hypothetical protein